MSSFRGVLFDMDGVVLDSETIHAEAETRLLAQFDLDISPDVRSTFKGRSNVDVFGWVAQEYGDGRVTSDELILHKQRHMADLADRLQMIDGALDTIRAVHDAGIAAALVTSSPQTDQQHAFDLFELTDYFQAVVTMDDVTRFKPDPMPYVTGARLLGLDASDCVAIEDSVSGIRSAQAAGARTIGLVGTFDASTLHDAGADAVAHSHAEIRALLGLSETD